MKEVKIMKCKHPFMRDPAGKIRWSTKMSKEDMLGCTPFPCGICLHCKINRRRVWVFRLLLEQRTQKKSSFVTLTYNDDNLVYTDDYIQNLCKIDLQKFLKRLRKKTSTSIRYYAVGEYGDESWRPHYHLALFGLDISDYQIIYDAWQIDNKPIGFIQVAELNKDTASYIAGYIIKKLTSKKDSRLMGRNPEFMCSSRGKLGGIGLPYIKGLAERLNKNPYYEPQIITEIYKNGKPQPLGRYLTTKLAELTHVPKEFFDKKYVDYMNTLYNDGIDPEDAYWQKQIEDDKKMLSTEKKHAIFKKRRIL